MSCCGEQRASLRHNNPVDDRRSPVHYWNPGAIGFQYSGNGQLTVIGPLTGTTYRFTNGATVLVHASDAASLVAVPGLKPLH